MISERIKELTKVLEDNTALVVTSDENRFYLSGFHSSAGWVVITKNTAALLVDFRYFEKASAEVSDLNVKLTTKPYDDIKEILNYTKDVLTCDIHNRFKTKELLKENGANVKSNIYSNANNSKRTYKK